ncbi:cytochrome C peroxidase [Rhodomicrobium udaipurense JA643]|uniref:Cytochrome-c peroxidase n=1 Tax=Rhodomicrobium udaipurense TaxID=1202716 RepID=A0A8I1KKF7_9HYPH|nr:cytochrome c peroxidase [Rhodomicrobium udaipurense]KAI93686.1 cytochrome C peroxidase [Rhodomicrobium udaipurense JA643]MBJ7544106.1 cytochrome-c peroxidase [Rhodomicrobium udaipurense]
MKHVLFSRRLFFGVAAAAVAMSFLIHTHEQDHKAEVVRTEAARFASLKAEAEQLVADFPSGPDAQALGRVRMAYERARAAWPAPVLLPDAKVAEFAPLDIRPKPSGIAIAKVELGRMLFEDPRLSASGQIACQNCHNQELGWGDGLRSSFGHNRKRGKRNAPPLFSAAYRPALFWDGRVTKLEEQALGPMTNPIEMAVHDFSAVTARLGKDDIYRERFRSIYGSDQIDIAWVADALAAFETTLERPTRFDRFLKGDTAALTDEQVWGMHLFRTKAGCMNCHSGPLLTDERYHNLGLSLLGRPLGDPGRQAVTGLEDDVGRFRTASLRHVSKTGPYMHNGLIPDLRRVVIFYEIGGGKTRPLNDEQATDDLMRAAAKTSPLVKKFNFTPAERQALIEFLKAL